MDIYKITGERIGFVYIYINCAHLYLFYIYIWIKYMKYIIYCMGIQMLYSISISHTSFVSYIISIVLYLVCVYIYIHMYI